jgi:hypothetical protein
MEISMDVPQKIQNGWEPVAHACNPSYPGGRNQEDCDLNPVWANSLQDLISKKPITKWLVEWLKVKALSSSPSAIKIKVKNRTPIYPAIPLLALYPKESMSAD